MECDYADFKQQFCLTCCSNKRISTSQKYAILENRIASDADNFHRIQTARKFAYASCEQHYTVAERHMIFLRFRKMVLQKNR